MVNRHLDRSAEIFGFDINGDVYKYMERSLHYGRDDVLGA